MILAVHESGDDGLHDYFRRYGRQNEKVKVDLLDTDRLIFPLCIGGTHYILVVVYLSRVYNTGDSASTASSSGASALSVEVSMPSPSTLKTIEVGMRCFNPLRINGMDGTREFDAIQKWLSAAIHYQMGDNFSNISVAFRRDVQFHRLLSSSSHVDSGLFCMFYADCDSSDLFDVFDKPPKTPFAGYVVSDFRKKVAADLLRGYVLYPVKDIVSPSGQEAAERLAALNLEGGDLDEGGDVDEDGEDEDEDVEEEVEEVEDRGLKLTGEKRKRDGEEEGKD